MKKIMNIIIALYPITWASICILTVAFQNYLPAYWHSFVWLLLVALLLLAPAAGIWFVLKWITKATIGSGAAATETGPAGSPSDGRPRKARLHDYGALLKSLGVARQPDGGSIVFPYMFLWRGYRLAPEQTRSYLAWWGESALDGWKKHRAAYVLFQVTGSAACLCLLWSVYRPGRWSILALVVALAATAGSTLLLRARTKRSFENQYPTATERRPDPNRLRKRFLLLMLTPLWGHMGSGIIAPLLLWLAALGVADIATALSDGTFDVAMAKQNIAVILLIAAFAAFACYVACRHIAFRIRHGRGVSVDDFYAL